MAKRWPVARVSCLQILLSESRITFFSLSWRFYSICNRQFLAKRFASAESMLRRDGDRLAAFGVVQRADEQRATQLVWPDRRLVVVGRGRSLIAALPADESLAHLASTRLHSAAPVANIAGAAAVANFAQFASPQFLCQRRRTGGDEHIPLSKRRRRHLGRRRRRHRLDLSPLQSVLYALRSLASRANHRRLHRPRRRLPSAGQRLSLSTL